MAELNNTILKNNTNLKFYGRFESGAETTDSSGNSHTLTEIATPTFSAGKFGQGVNYASASSQAHSALDHADFKPTGAFSVGFWLKTSEINEYICQSFAATATRNGWNFYNDVGKIWFEVASGAASIKRAETAATFNDGNWHFCVGTWDTANVRIYIDSAIKDTQAWANAPTYEATNYVRFGCANVSGSNSSFFGGSLDDVFLLNGTALSADQIKELYEGRYVGEGWPQSGLVAGYHLSDTTDFSGNNYHLTNNNTVTFPAGKFINCADFGASNTNKTLSRADALGIDGNSSMTVSMWVNISANPGVGVLFALFSHFPASTRFIRCGYRNNAGSYEIQANGGGTDTFFTKTLTVGTWYHIVFSRTTTSSIVVYVNGNSLGSASVGASTTAGTTFALADWSGGSNVLSGKLDEVQIYNVAKDARWVRQQYALGVGKFY